jgi:iron(III) transport system ATP-binding protein
MKKSFPTARGMVEAVRGIDLDVQAGEFCVLLGHSGCGKTTTLRCVAGLEKPERGEICIGDRVVNAPDRGIFVPPELRGIGMVFQSYAVWPHMTVSQNIAFPLVHGRNKVPTNLVRDKVKRVLELVQLEGLADRPATDLSGGQQQRVAMARALVTEPQVLLMDEPLSNLDARLRQEMRGELKKLTRRLGITSLFVTHDQSEALTLGDTVCVMSQGEILQRGAPEAIYCSPANPFVANFVGEMNFLEGRVGGSQAVETSLGTFVCQLPPKAANGAAVTIAIRPEDIRLTDETARADNTVPGVVVGRYFLGDSVYWEIEAGIKKFMVRSSRESARLQDRVLLCFPQEHLIVFVVGGGNG